MIADPPPRPDTPVTFSGPEWVVLGVLVGTGFWLRLRWVASAFLFGDEMHSLRLLPLSYREIVATFDRVGSGLALPLLQKLSVDLFGTFAQFGGITRSVFLADQ